MRLKAFSGIMLTVFLISILSMGVDLSFASSENPAENGSPGTDTVSYDHWSVLTVVETITDLGGGTWKYSYEFTNTETSGIWHFLIWTTFYTTAQTPFSLPGWAAVGMPIESVYPAYDARNLDPGITWSTNTWGNPWEWPTDPIEVGMVASGFSFQANVYDPSPKYYCYEFVGTYAGPPDLPVTAVGLTGPAPKPVGGEATPIYIPMNNPEMSTLLIWLTTIIPSLIVTVVYVKKRKRNTEINS